MVVLELLPLNQQLSPPGRSLRKTHAAQPSVSEHARQHAAAFATDACPRGSPSGRHSPSSQLVWLLHDHVVRSSFPATIGVLCADAKRKGLSAFWKPLKYVSSASAHCACSASCSSWLAFTGANQVFGIPPSPTMSFHLPTLIAF